ncbi:MAG: hypothetical protein HC800_18860 [Phormidesmis sp. RL_2_1]|nr:hypothetical protein [Phormidesmis sp. RL_2_1]
MNKKVLAGVGAAGGAIALILGGQVLVSHAATKELDKAIAEVADYVDIDYQKVETSFFSRTGRVKDITLSPVGSNEQYKADELVVKKYEEKDSIPTAVNMAIKGIQLDSALLGNDTDMFKELGYEGDISMNIATDYAYEADQQALTLKSVKVGADQLGDFDLNLHLEKVDLSEEMMASFPFSLLSAEFHGAKITYKDDSFITRMFDTAAAANGVSVEDFKKEAIASLKDDPEIAAVLTDEQRQEIEKFINNPKGFAISMSPAEPVPFSAVMTASAGGPTAIAELLAVQFKAD